MLIWMVEFTLIHYFLFKVCLYHQTHVMNVHFWRKFLLFSLGKNLMYFKLLCNNSFIFLIIINTTVVQLVLSERKRKSKITVKNPLTNNCNTVVDSINLLPSILYTGVWIVVFPSLLHYSLKILIKFKPVIYL